MSLAWAIGNTGGPAARRVRRTFAHPCTLVRSAASIATSNAPPGPAPVIAGGPSTVTVGAALLLDGAVTTTREPGWSTASTSACWRCVGAWVPASRSCRASRARARPRLETAGLPPAS